MPLTGIPGRPPDLARPPAGCRFAPRCPRVMDRCQADEPELYPVDGVDVRCLLHDGSSSDDEATRDPAAGPRPTARGGEPLLRTRG